MLPLPNRVTCNMPSTTASRKSRRATPHAGSRTDRRVSHCSRARQTRSIYRGSRRGRTAQPATLLFWSDRTPHQFEEAPALHDQGRNSLPPAHITSPPIETLIYSCRVSPQFPPARSASSRGPSLTVLFSMKCCWWMLTVFLITLNFLHTNDASVLQLWLLFFMLPKSNSLLVIIHLRFADSKFLFFLDSKSFIDARFCAWLTLSNFFFLLIRPFWY